MPRKKKDNEIYSHWTWGQDPTSRLAEYMVYCYYNDVSCCPVVYGDPRIGKSGYAEKVGYQVMNKITYQDDPINRDPLAIHKITMGHDPIDVVKAWRSVMRPDHPVPYFRNNKLPYYWWDDGGIFLFSGDYQKKEVKIIMKYVQIVFTKIQVFGITSPTPKNIASGIRTIPSSLWVEITRRDGSIQMAPLTDSKRYSRTAQAYRPWITKDLARLRVWRGVRDHFDCRMPDVVYRYYAPTRKAYTHEFEDDMLAELTDDKTRRDKINMIDEAVIELEDEI